MITEIIEFAGFDGHLVPICISARNSRLDGDGCFDRAPGERTFYRVKVPKPPGSGKV